jgi:hypothetical protein
VSLVKGAELSDKLPIKRPKSLDFPCLPDKRQAIPFVHLNLLKGFACHDKSQRRIENEDNTFCEDEFEPESTTLRFLCEEKS